MKKLRIYFSFAALICVFVFSGTKSYADNGGYLLDKINCQNSGGTTVAYGCECDNGDSSCIPNPCPKGTHQQ